MNLQYDNLFIENTSQGIVGILKKTESKGIFTLNNLPITSNNAVDHINDKTISKEENCYVFKISKLIDTIIDHEYKISQDLEQLSSFLPNFNKILEIKRNVKCLLPNTWIKHSYNPFKSYNCRRDVSIIEYIPSKVTFLDYIKKNRFNNVTHSLIHQTILAIFIAQQEINFTHYDLHLDNILIRQCNPRTFFLYKFSYEGVVFNRLLHSNGYFPVLFDYGYAYSKGLDNTNYNNSFFFTHKGYTSFMYDEVNDFKTLLIRLSYIRDCPSKIKELTNKLFLNKDLPITVCKESGWIKNKSSLSIGKMITKKIEKIMKKNNQESKFIYKELEYIIDLFGILVKTPFTYNDFNMKNLPQVVRIFTKEWNKLDKCFSEIFEDDKLNIIKHIFLTINSLIEEGIEQEELNRRFKLKLFEILDDYGKFINIEEFNYGKFLLSTLELSNFIEHATFQYINYYNTYFTYSYSGWELFDSIESIFDREESIPFKYNDKIVMFDCIQKTTLSINLKNEDELVSLNLSSLKEQETLLMECFKSLNKN